MSRRRFLLDLLLVGGAIALAAGLAATSPPPAPQLPVADAHRPQFQSIVGGFLERP